MLAPTDVFSAHSCGGQQGHRSHREGKMPQEWYISFHGGEEKSSLNNIHVYDTEGRKLRKALNKKSLDAGVELRELRGLVFGPDKNLYVVNAYCEYSEILKFKGE